jgi:hypothetical protein
LTKTSPPGLRQAARGGTSSEEEEGGLAGEDKVYHGRDVTPRSDPIDIPGARIHRPEDLVIPFAPQRPYTFRDSGFGTVQPSSATPVNRQITFSSADTLVEGSTPSRQMTFGSANTMVAGASTAREMTFSRQSIEDFGRTDVLHATQSDDPDMIFGMGDEITERNDIPVSGASLITVVARSGAGPQLMGNPTQIPANLINPEASIQSHVTGPADAQAPINSAAAGVIQLNIPAASNVAQGSGNLVQAQLDIGRPTNLMCNICRFTFNRTVLADARAHSQYHDSHTLGEPIIGLTTTSRYHLRRIETGIGEGDYVVMVDRSSTQGWKDVAMAVLETHVDRELNSVAISASRLWSSIADPAITGRNSEANPVDRYKVYMYVRRYQPKLGRVVSLLLAERITTGFETNRIQIQADEFGAWPSIVRNVQTVVSTKAHEAVLGINKFWTISNSRRNGYGRVLLNQARQNFLPYYIIPRIHIAWTYTTDDGANFAKAYLQGQTDYDYLTYDDHV